MEAQAVDWTPALVILAIGLALGAFFVFRARRAARSAAALGSPADLERRDLEGQREALLAQLRELEDTSAKLTAEQLQSQRGALELELARVLRALDQQGGVTRRPAAASAEAVPAVPAAAAAAPASPGSSVKGFLWGVGSMAAVAGLFLWVSRSAEVRQQGAPPTGQGMGAGPSQQAPQSGPATDEERQLQARVDQNPEDLEARLQLGEAYLRRGDLMGVWNESKYVIDRQPDDPRAQMLQAIARTAMGQPEMAAQLLEKAVAKAPEMEEAHLQLGRAYLIMGREKDAERAFAAARQRFPEDAPEISRIYEELKQQIASEGAGLPQGENPHAKVGAPGAPAAQPAAAAQPAPAAAPNGPTRRVAGQIEIDPALLAQVAPGSVIYVMARPAGETGGPPVGVVRLPATGFPVSFELGDGQSMSGAPLPDQLRLEARVDKDGNAATKDPDDPRAVLDNVGLGRADVKLVLKR